MNFRRAFLIAAAALWTAISGAAALAQQQAEAPDAYIKRISGDVLEAIRADRAIQAGDMRKLAALVDNQVMPALNFQRMTASAVGRYWRQATPAQQLSLQNEFKALLVRTYAGALGQVRNQRIDVKPLRGNANDPEVVVRTEVRGAGEPIQLDYRLEQAGGAGWKIYDVNVMGIWLVETYRGSFSQEIAQSGIDGLIAKLHDKNKATSGT